MIETLQAFACTGFEIGLHESASQCFKRQFKCDVCKILPGSFRTFVNAVPKPKSLKKCMQAFFPHDNIWNTA